jgi:hypothetical protein
VDLGKSRIPLTRRPTIFAGVISGLPITRRNICSPLFTTLRLVRNKLEQSA